MKNKGKRNESSCKGAKTMGELHRLAKEPFVVWWESSRRKIESHADLWRSKRVPLLTYGWVTCSTDYEKHTLLEIARIRWNGERYPLFNET